MFICIMDIFYIIPIIPGNDSPTESVFLSHGSPVRCQHRDLANFQGEAVTIEFPQQVRHVEGFKGL